MNSQLAPEIRRKAVLFRVSTSRERFSCRDKKVEQEIEIAKNSDEGIARVLKRTLLKEDVGALESLMNKILPTVYKYTSPFEDRGWRILAAGLVEKLEGELSDLKVKIDEAKLGVIQKLPEAMARMKDKAGELYDENKIPNDQEISDSFSFRIRYAPIPDKEHVLLDIASDVNDKIKSKVESDQNFAIETAMKAMWERTFNTVKYLRDRMEEYSEKLDDADRKRMPTLKGAVLEHVQQMGELLTHMNYTNDPKLETVRQEIEKSFAEFSTDDLKEDKGKENREKIVKEADKILEKMKGVVI